MNDTEHLVEDHELEAFLASAIFGVDTEIDEDMPAPDLAAVVALAHQFDPNAVPEGWLEESSGLAPIISFKEGRRFRNTQNDPEMAAIVAQVRASMDHDIGVELVQRSYAVGAASAAVSAPVSTSSSATASVVPLPKRSVGRSWYVGLAAAALLMVGGAALATAKLVQRENAERVPAAALSERLSTPTTHEAEMHDSAPAATRTIPGAGLQEPEPVEPVEEPEAAVEEPEVVAKRPVNRESREDKLTRLDREAHEAWKAGQLGVARSKFEKIVKIGGKDRLADLAYGDLFTLARRSGETKREAKLWKSYLRRFPQGRFVDDARAGLCRRASDSKKGECWERYLRDLPEGSYRAQAQRELGPESK